MLGALALLVSLFLTWSHQFSSAVLLRWGKSVLLRGVPDDPTAWQLYSVADVLLALVAAWLAWTALLGARRAHLGGLVAVAAASAFTLHALSVPPTNGANLLDPTAAVPRYLPASASAGIGETIALAALAVAAAGLALALTAD